MKGGAASRDCLLFWDWLLDELSGGWAGGRAGGWEGGGHLTISCAGLVIGWVIGCVCVCVCVLCLCVCVCVCVCVGRGGVIRPFLELVFELDEPPDLFLVTRLWESIVLPWVDGIAWRWS